MLQRDPETLTRLGAASADATTTLALTELETTATNIATLDLTTTTSTASVDSGDGTTTGTLSSETTVTELSASTATAATTSDSASQPTETFFLSAAVSGAVSPYLSSAKLDGSLVGWNTARSIIGESLSFTIEAGTNYAAEVSGYYLCVKYGMGNRIPKYARLCTLADISQTRYGVLTCEQTASQKLACSVTAGQCVIDLEAGQETCSLLSGLFDQFYAYSSGSTRSLAMGSLSNPLPSDSYQAIELEVKES
ncbi:hypothetical protein ACHAP5_004470 [Fusarium lateritium]